MSTALSNRPAERLDPVGDSSGVRYLRPGDVGYEPASTAWNRLGSHRPAVVAIAQHAEHVVEAVRYARAEGFGVGVMATGHGTATAVRGGMLINTSAMQELSVDPITATARVGAGVSWERLNARAAQHGLFGLQGSNSIVGVAGYSLGGGFGWLGRHHGFASQTIVSADLVTADGELITVTERNHPELFWGLRGSAGNLGVVTALELRLVELDVVYGGALYYLLADAHRVLTEYRDWAARQPNELASSATLVNFPALPFLPEPLRGKSFACVRLCYSGRDLGPGVAAVRELRQCLGVPLIDDVRRMPATELDRISAEPRDPIAVVMHSELIQDLTPDVVDALVREQTADSPLLFVELRQLGGALRVPEDQLSPLNRTGAGFTVNAAGLAVSPELHAAATAKLAALTRRLAPLADGAGYVNFLEGAEGAERIRSAFSAPEWERLTDLKTRWDPDNLFRFNRNIPPHAGAMSPA